MANALYRASYWKDESWWKDLLAVSIRKSTTPWKDRGGSETTTVARMFRVRKRLLSNFPWKFSMTLVLENCVSRLKWGSQVLKKSSTIILNSLCDCWKTVWRRQFAELKNIIAQLWKFPLRRCADQHRRRREECWSTRRKGRKPRFYPYLVSCCRHLWVPR